MPKLILSDVHKKLGENQILRGVSFELSRGEVVALLGPSGSGKTTLLRAIAGLDHPDTGRITLDDQVFFDSAGRQVMPAEKRNLGLVFQSYALWPHRTVFENVAYGLKLRKVPTAEIAARVSAVLAQIGLEALAARYPHQVSGGQQQRVALARALVYDPRLILLDEPLSNLDAKLREEARLWLRELIQRLGISAVMVTHDQTEALAVADRILLLDKGRIEQDATPMGIYEQPATLFAAEFMGTNNRLEGRIAEVRGEPGPAGRRRLAALGPAPRRAPGRRRRHRRHPAGADRARPPARARTGSRRGSTPPPTWATAGTTWSTPPACGCGSGRPARRPSRPAGSRCRPVALDLLSRARRFRSAARLG